MHRTPPTTYSRRSCFMMLLLLLNWQERALATAKFSGEGGRRVGTRWARPAIKGGPKTERHGNDRFSLK